jgi:1,4-dihydroxy-2-naphthoyl-CoA hydrolase
VSDASATEFIRSAMPLAGLLGIEAVTNTKEEVRLRLQWQESLCTTGGLLHGGALMALADSAGAACAFANLPEGATGTTTIESKTNFLRAVRDRHVDAVARPLHVGRTVIVIETDVLDADDRRVARVTQTQAVLS